MRLLDEVTEFHSEWAGQERARNGPETGHTNQVIPSSYDDERAKSGPRAGQERCGNGQQRLIPTDTDTNTDALYVNQDESKGPTAIERQVWSQLIVVLEESTGKRSRLKLTKWRATMLGERLSDYPVADIVHAWRWWCCSVDDYAVMLRAKFGVDTFLRRSNHDKYQTASSKWMEHMREPGEDATIEEMRAYLDYQNRLEISR